MAQNTKLKLHVNSFDINNFFLSNVNNSTANHIISKKKIEKILNSNTDDGKKLILICFISNLEKLWSIPIISGILNPLEQSLGDKVMWNQQIRKDWENTIMDVFRRLFDAQIIKEQKGRE